MTRKFCRCEWLITFIIGVLFWIMQYFSRTNVVILALFSLFDVLPLNICKAYNHVTCSVSHTIVCRPRSVTCFGSTILYESISKQLRGGALLFVWYCVSNQYVCNGHYLPLAFQIWVQSWVAMIRTPSPDLQILIMSVTVYSPWRIYRFWFHGSH